MNCNLCGEEFEEFSELTKHLVNKHEYSSEQIYNYFSYSFQDKNATCPICGKEFTMTSRQIKNYLKGKSKAIGCCAKCSRELLYLLYGNPSTWASVKEKKKQTNLERYGVENVFQLSSVKEKTKQTNLEKYGVEYVMQSSEVKEKSRQTTIKNYGVSHISKLEEIKEKKKQASIKHYGVENISQAEEIKEKKKKLSLEKYGTNYTLQAPEIREKSKQTNLERYGVEFTTQVPEIKEKIKLSNLKKYGVEYGAQSSEIQEKMKLTNLKHYGVEYAIQAKEVKDRAKQTNLEKYGVEYFCQHKNCIEANYNRVSKVNKKFQEFLSKNNVSSELEFIIKNVGYDLKVGKVLIEINPYFTHNTTVGPCFGGKKREPLPFDYHLMKTKIALENGFHCIHIFDWDNWNKIVLLLKDKVKVQARKCEVREVDKKLAKKFLDEYHLQESTRVIKYAYGLFYNNKLIQIMTFGKPRYNKKYEYELLRLCTHPEFSVVGGASKILTYFEKQNKPISIISYCDKAKFSGEVYTKLGFSFITEGKPSKHWYNPKTKKHITDNLLRQRGFDQLHKSNYGKGTSNEQLMREHGYIEIYDCGQTTFIKTYT